MNLFTIDHMFLGPNIQEVDSLPDDLVFIGDHIGHDDDSAAWDHLDQLIHKRSTVARPVVLEYLDSWELSPESASKCIFLPLQSYYTSWTIDKLLPPVEWAEKTSAVNFMINKHRPNRQLLLKTLDQLGLSTDTYSLTWTDKSTLHNFEPRYIAPDQTYRVKDCISNRSWTNPQLYQHWLKDHVFEPSIVSLITEPDWASKSAFVTEKTIFAFEAGTIPIWIGGQYCAETFRRLGFHIFTDVIDHSYQAIPDPEGRVRAAIELNRKVLSDFEFLREYWTTNREKFEHNRKLCRSGAWFYSLLDRQIRKKQLDIGSIQKITIDLMFNHNYEISQLRNR